jgi:hypothetical protein
MNCRRAKKLIFEFVDGHSDEKLKLDLERHLGECAECEKLATSLAGSLALIRRTPQEPVDENFNWRVRLAVHKERKEMQELASSQGSLFRAWNLRYATSAAAGFAAILAAGWLTISLIPGPTADNGLTAESGAPAASRGMDTAENPAQSDPPANFVNPDPMAGPGRMVSGGSNTGAGGNSRGGAIDVEDVVHNPAAFDSLFEIQMQGMPEDVRVRVLRQHLMLMQKRLDACGRTGEASGKDTGHE